MDKRTSFKRLSDGTVLLPFRMEICFSKGQRPTQQAISQLRSHVKDVIWDCVARGDAEICELTDLKGLGTVLVTNNGDLSTYAVALEDFTDPQAGSQNEADLPVIMTRKGVLIFDSHCGKNLAA
jgi:hypothetical protein